MVGPIAKRNQQRMQGGECQPPLRLDRVCPQHSDSEARLLLDLIEKCGLAGTGVSAKHGDGWFASLETCEHS